MAIFMQGEGWKWWKEIFPEHVALNEVRSILPPLLPKIVVCSFHPAERTMGSMKRSLLPPFALSRNSAFRLLTICFCLAFCSRISSAWTTPVVSFIFHTHDSLMNWNFGLGYFIGLWVLIVTYIFARKRKKIKGCCWCYFSVQSSLSFVWRRSKK